MLNPVPVISSLTDSVRITPRPASLFVGFVVLIAALASCTSTPADTVGATPTSQVTAGSTTVPTTVPATATSTSTATPQPSTDSTPTHSSPGPDPLIGLIPIPPERDLYELARRITLRSIAPVPRLASPIPPQLETGDRISWLVSRDAGNVIVNAEVRFVSEHAVWVFEEGTDPEQGRLEQAASQFELVIWPSVSASLGEVWSPGIDGDPRIVIFHGKLRSGVAGYFSGIDEYPVQIQPDSNQREVIYISSDNLTLGGTAYLGTIAHELQHAIHWAADPGEDSWLNEGMSEVAAGLAGFPPGSISAFLRKPNTSLVQWAPEIFEASPNYGAAGLFFEYISAHYGGTQMLRAIIEHPADGFNSIDAVMAASGFDTTSSDLFADWVVANYVDDSSGIYSYPDRDISRPTTTFIPVPETVSESVRPFGTNYYTLQDTGNELTIGFQGESTGRVFPADPHSGDTCWWANAGDSIDTTLTRSVDLREFAAASFRFWAWYSIEEEWDYAYVEVSTDGGITWQIVETARSSTGNPNGTSFGPGLTGNSAEKSSADDDGWVRDVADLSRFAGTEILLRLEHITDDAIHDRGICFDDFEITEIGWTDSTDDSGGWISDGFALINDDLPAEYLIQVIRSSANKPSEVERFLVTDDGIGEFKLSGLNPDEEVIVAVSLVTANVTGSLSYAINFSN